MNIEPTISLYDENAIVHLMQDHYHGVQDWDYLSVVINGRLTSVFKFEYINHEQLEGTIGQALELTNNVYQALDIALSNFNAERIR